MLLRVSTLWWLGIMRLYGCLSTLHHICGFACQQKVLKINIIDKKVNLTYLKFEIFILYIDYLHTEKTIKIGIYNKRVSRFPQ